MIKPETRIANLRHALRAIERADAASALTLRRSAHEALAADDPWEGRAHSMHRAGDDQP